MPKLAPGAVREISAVPDIRLPRRDAPDTAEAAAADDAEEDVVMDAEVEEAGGTSKKLIEDLEVDNIINDHAGVGYTL